ncbi:DNA-directed RNA polymerase I subunit rpa49 [Termitomyces sp. J132]|nr:hypothetical protein H2248_002492 [Termitomyces sp. 'cryptogamus']KNZ75590.1 DNA-directed RNA polymerase I subunit rpa49 [Termitomyces sp. J132]
MSTVKSSSKKRKHDSISSEGVVVKLAAPTSVVGPLLVSYPALQAPSSTPFKCYANKKAKNESKQPENAESINEQNLLVVGETEDVEFISNEGESKKAAESGCRYLIAVHNRRTSTLRILPVAKTPYILTRTVKALKSIPVSAPSQHEYRQARNVLGETFGTKKAKANIRAQERNRVDVSAMQGVMDHLQQGIDKGAVGLMTSEEAKVEADKNRLIPPFDITAIDPEDSYPLHNIIPEVEWKALSISAFDQAAGPGERKALLPFKWSNWINSHINATCADTHSPKRRKKNLKLLLYISAMFAFRRAVEFKKNIGKDDLTEKLSVVPSIIVEGLISRFTETSRGSSGYTSTSATQTKLLSYMFALCLKVDNFASDTSHIAHDLNKPLAEINTLFRSLGCKIGLLGDKERAKLGLSDKDATDKRAILNAPLTFPKPRLRRK